MGIKASTIIAKAQTLLGDTDETGIQYLVADLKKYLNEGQIEIVKIDPQANPTRESVLLAAGTKQSLPANSLGLIKPVRNMGPDGTTDGEIVRMISRKVLDELYPGWHTATAKTTTKYVIYDPRVSRDTFDIYPPATSSVTQYLEIIHGELPDTITDFNNTDIIHDRYDADLVDYILYRAKSMHAEYAAAGGEAVAHLAKFETSVKSKM